MIATMTMNAAVNVILTMTVTVSVNVNVNVNVNVTVTVIVTVTVTCFDCYRQLYSTIIRLFKDQIRNFLEKVGSFATFKIILPFM